MPVSVRRLWFGFCGFLLFAPVAVADYSTALREYQAGEFDKAFAEFRQLAQLGHVQSQYMLGAMYARGEGVGTNRVLAHGWIKLAADAGHRDALKLVTQLQSVLPPEGLASSQRLLAEFTPESLRARLLPKILPDCDYSNIVPAKPKKSVRMSKFPMAAVRNNVEGYVLLDLTLGKDGSVRDARIIQAVPRGYFETAVLEDASRWKFQPAIRSGVPVASHYAITVSFQIANLGYREASKNQWIADALREAESGNSAAQYLYGILIAGHPEFRRPWSEALVWIEKAAQGGYAPAQFQLGESLRSGRGCVPDERKAVEWLDLAARQGDADAQIALALRSLQPGDAYEPEKAVRWLTMAIENDHSSASKYLAAVRAASLDERLRAPAQALEMIRQFKEQHGNEPTTLEIEAAALAADGDYQGAEKVQSKAIKRARRLQWDISAMNERLAKYRTGQPWFGDLLTL